jgi:hypothetical protein
MLESAEQAQPRALKRESVQRRSAEPYPEQECRDDVSNNERNSDGTQRRQNGDKTVFDDQYPNLFLWRQFSMPCLRVAAG